MSDAERTSRQVEHATPSTFKKIHDILMAERRLNGRGNVKALDTSQDLVVLILNYHWGMRKLFER